jgi:hypothetical protein
VGAGGAVSGAVTANSAPLGDASGGKGGSVDVTVIPTAISGRSGDTTAQSSATNTGDTGWAASTGTASPVALSGSSGPTGDAAGKKSSSGGSGSTGDAAAIGSARSAANSGARGNAVATSGQTGAATNDTRLVLTGGQGSLGGASNAVPGQAGIASNTVAGMHAVGTTQALPLPLANMDNGPGGDVRGVVTPTARTGDSGQTRSQSSATNTGDTGPASSTAWFLPVARSGDSGATGSTGGAHTVFATPVAPTLLMAARAIAAPTPPTLGPATTGHGGTGTAVGSGPGVADPTSVVSGSGFAQDGSVASGCSVAIDHSVASGCSTARHNSVASGGFGPSAAARPVPAQSAPQPAGQEVRRLATTGLPVGRLAGEGVLSLVLGCLLLGLGTRRSKSNRSSAIPGISQHDSNTCLASITPLRWNIPTLDHQSRVSA